MEEALLADDVYLRGVLDTVPGFLFIVNHDVRIMHLNAAVRDVLGLDLAKVYRMRAGMALDCMYQYQTERGCGRNAACEDCVIRMVVGDAIQGFSSDRKPALLERMYGGVEKLLHLQVMASPIRYRERTYVLLVLEPSTI